MNLENLGWDFAWESLLELKKQENNNCKKTNRKNEKDAFLARVTSVHRSYCQAESEIGPINVYLPGKFLHAVINESEFPVVGDWISAVGHFIDEQGCEASMMQEILPRRTVFARAVSGGAEQVLASNVDTVIIVSSANANFNLNRIRRYVHLAVQGRAQPVIVLSKVDLAENAGQLLDEVKSCFVDHLVISISAVLENGLMPLENVIQAGKTYVLVGSSGVGKSTIVNSLIGQNTQVTQDIRNSDSRGRHTTTHRELFILANGGLLIDTPGLREVGVFGELESNTVNENAVENAAKNCRFVDCNHGESSQGCGLHQALEEGLVTEKEVASFFKLRKELEFSSRKIDRNSYLKEKKKWKEISMKNKQRRKVTGR